MINNISLYYGKSSLFPLILDYDFEKMRPRGLSSKIAFFTYGYLCDLVDNNEPYNGLLFIKDKTFVFNEGFFLIDYKDLFQNFHSYLKKFKDMGLNRLYFENSISEELINETDMDIFIVEIL